MENDVNIWALVEALDDIREFATKGMIRDYDKDFWFNRIHETVHNVFSEPSLQPYLEDLKDSKPCPGEVEG